MPRIRFQSQCFMWYTDGDLALDKILAKAPFLSPHPTKVGVYYCTVNPFAQEWMQKKMSWILKRFVVEDKVRMLVHFNPAEPIEPIPLVGLNGVTLKDYQEHALDLMLTHKNYCVFLGMGTGKTIIALTWLKSLEAKYGAQRVFILTPKKVVSQYYDEIEKFYPECKHDITVTNFEQLPKYKGLHTDIFIIDESHRLKKYGGVQNKIARGITAKHTYLFTGTPQDKLRSEVLGQLSIINEILHPPKYLLYGRYFELDDFRSPKRETRPQELDLLMEQIAYGAESDSVLNLPKAHHHFMDIKMKDKSKYNTLERDHILEINDDITIVADTPGARRMKLKQMANGFVMDEEGKAHMTSYDKINAFEELIKTVPHAVIFTNFHMDQTLCAAVLKKHNKNFGVVNGKLKSKDNDATIQAFKEGVIEYLVINAVSGHAGLNLIITNNMIFYSLPDSFVIFDQCLYRTRRYGQTKECHYYYLTAKGTVDMMIKRALSLKKSFNTSMFKKLERKK